MPSVKFRKTKRWEALEITPDRSVHAGFFRRLSRWGIPSLMPGEEHSFAPPQHTGQTLYHEQAAVGTSYHLEDCLAWIQGYDQSLELQFEPSNPHDPNAIKVIGHSEGLLRRKHFHLGYLPRDIAASIQSRKPVEIHSITPLLRSIWLKDDKTSVCIRMDIITMQRVSFQRMKDKDFII